MSPAAGHLEDGAGDVARQRRRGTGRPWRPPPALRRAPCGTSASLAAKIAGFIASGHRGADQAGLDGVDADAGGSEFLGGGLGEPDRGRPWPRCSWSGRGCRPCRRCEDMLTIDAAALLAHDRGGAHRVPSQAPFRWTSRTASKSARVILRMVASRVMPALLTMTSIRAEARRRSGRRGRRPRPRR